jgi:hypothetical protein
MECGAFGGRHAPILAYFTCRGWARGAQEN